jgi:Domain of unknown function (DUF3471)
MRKLAIVLFAMTCSVVLNAQQAPAADSLKEYTGKYKFPDGSPVSEVTLTLQDGVLFGTSAMGSSEFKRIDKDLFAVVAYSGTATFKRNDQSKVNGVKIEVDDLVLEGTKSEDAIYQPDRLKIFMIRD